MNRRYVRLKINKRLTVLTIVIFIISMSLAWSGDKILWILNIVIALGYAYFISGDIFIGMFKAVLKKR